MNKWVLDSSALLAALFDEPGATLVMERGQGSWFSAVNYSETLSKCVDRGADLDQVEAIIRHLSLTIVPFEIGLARAAASLRVISKSLGLSFADRACLGLAMSQRCPVLTADRRWIELNLEIPIELVR